MNLDEMSIEEKIVALEQCIARASMDVEYSVQCALGDYKDELLRKMMEEVKNAKLLFGSSARLSQLDYDQRVIATNNWNTLLTKNLQCFPEYNRGRSL